MAAVRNSNPEKKSVSLCIVSYPSANWPLNLRDKFRVKVFEKKCRNE
jgi:hypothetical protein